MNAAVRLLGAFLLLLVLGGVGYSVGVMVREALAFTLIAGLVAGGIGALLLIYPLDFLAMWLLGAALVWTPWTPIAVLGYILSVAGGGAVLSNLFTHVVIAERRELLKMLLKI
jgi:hypothetical protein